MAHLPLLLGHRGARASVGVPENTPASFDLALEHGCGGFEFDVRLTACGTAVVGHDPKVGKMTVASTAATRLPQLPRLNKVLQEYAQRAFLDIELKVENLESKVLAALHEFTPAKGYVVSSFLPDVVMEMEARSASVCIGIICENESQLAPWPELPVDYVIAHHSLVNEKLVHEVQWARRKILVWTVNDRESMLRFARWGVDGLISDETELLAQTLR
jgi:glycerophosphoryl diester phosphodiesterase